MLEVTTMDARMLNTIVNFIWGIADDCLRDVYVRGKYRDVILPMTVMSSPRSVRITRIGILPSSLTRHIPARTEKLRAR